VKKLNFRYIKNDTSRVEELTDTPWILKSIDMFNLYLADIYNALQTGKVTMTM